MGREFELKYRATAVAQEALLKDFGNFETVTMETTYYDTPDNALSQRRITLRRRFENGVSVCTVKTPAENGGRGEWELTADSVAEAIPELCKLGCPPELISLTAAGVAPICGARFTRKAKLLTTADCTVELALDAGVLLGGGKEQPLCEVEVEVKSGSETAAETFAQTLAQRYGLVPETKSKFRRALDLASGG